MIVLDRIFVTIVLALAASVLATEVIGTTWTRPVAAWLFVAFSVLGQARFGLRERFLQAIAAATVVATLLTRDDQWPLIERGLYLAGYLTTFMVLITSLRDGAHRSNSVLAIGRYLTERPPGRRYTALYLGGHLMGVLLNFGAISLLGPMIQRGVKAQSAGAPELVARIREQRQLVALTRGFAWFNLWAPTSIALATTMTIIPDARPGWIAVFGIAIALLLLGVGWIEDRVRGNRASAALRRQGYATPQLPSPPFPLVAVLKFLTVGVVLVGAGWSVAHLVHIRLVTGVFVVCVPVAAAWLVVQYLDGSAPEPGPVATITEMLLRSAPGGCREAATLALAGMTGALASEFVDAHSLSGLFSLSDVPQAALLVFLAGIIPIGSCLALPPILSVTFFGTLLVGLPELGINHTLLALALLCGWSLNLTGSPFSAASLVLQRVTGVPGTTHSWRWNGVYTLLAFLVAAAMLLVLSTVFA